MHADFPTRVIKILNCLKSGDYAAGKKLGDVLLDEIEAHTLETPTAGRMVEHLREPSPGDFSFVPAHWLTNPVRWAGDGRFEVLVRNTVFEFLACDHGKTWRWLSWDTMPKTTTRTFSNLGHNRCGICEVAAHGVGE